MVTKFKVIVSSRSFLSQIVSVWTSIMKRAVGLRLKGILVHEFKGCPSTSLSVMVNYAGQTGNVYQIQAHSSKLHFKIMSITGTLYVPYNCYLSTTYFTE